METEEASRDFSGFAAAVKGDPQAEANLAGDYFGFDAPPLFGGNKNNPDAEPEAPDAPQPASGS